MIEITVIGAGSGFDTQFTNSSFFIKVKDNFNKNYSLNVLFDCGYNVYPKLVDRYPEIIKDIDIVYISHMDDDHIGSLKSLIYHRYFKYNKSTFVVGYGRVYNELKNYLKDMNKIMIGGKFKTHPIALIYDSVISVTMINKSEFINKNNYIGFNNPPENFHHIPCYGFFVKDKHCALYITGDTKASYEKEEWFVKNTRDVNHKLIFHDFSFINQPSRNTHACESDMSVEYSKDFLSNVVLYHNEKSAKILEDKKIIMDEDGIHIDSDSFEENIFMDLFS